MIVDGQVSSLGSLLTEVISESDWVPSVVRIGVGQ